MKQHYRWSYVFTELNDFSKYHDTWINEDESLHNPNGYPEDLAREAVLKADAREIERVKRRVQKRKDRMAARVYEAARRILNNMGIGKQEYCYVCHKGLSDSVSIHRGIGSECWQHVLTAIEKQRSAASGTV